MNREQLVRNVAVQLGVTQTSVGKVLDAMTRTIIDEVSNGGRVSIAKFGTFKRVKNTHGTYYDFQTGTIKPRNPKNMYRPAFSPGTRFVEEVAKISDERN